MKTQTHTFPLSSLKGFVSEASNFLILRILARHKTVPENMTFLSFDANTVLSKSGYVSPGRLLRTLQDLIYRPNHVHDVLIIILAFVCFRGHLGGRTRWLGKSQSISLGLKGLSPLQRTPQQLGIATSCLMGRILSSHLFLIRVGGSCWLASFKQNQSCHNWLFTNSKHFQHLQMEF